jgi:hypothetical protein
LSISRAKHFTLAALNQFIVRIAIFGGHVIF